MKIRSIAVLIGSTFFMGSDLFGQSYIPLLNTTATWHDENGWGDPGPNTSDFECMRFFLDGDSIVDDVTYRVLRRTGIRYHNNNVFPDLNFTQLFSGEFVALLREDTAGHRVFIRPSTWPTDRLFYDFSADIGPYPSTYRFSNNRTVSGVDTVMLADGPHRRMNLVGGDAIIEGMGSTLSFMQHDGSGTHWLNRLTCHTAQDSVTYSVPTDFCACDTDVGIGTNVSSTVRVGPSPTKGLCRLEGASPMATYRVIGMDGRMVRTGHCTNGSATIDFTDLSAGIYVVEVLEVTGPLKVKVLKE